MLLQSLLWKLHFSWNTSLYQILFSLELMALLVCGSCFSIHCFLMSWCRHNTWRVWLTAYFASFLDYVSFFGADGAVQTLTLTELTAATFFSLTWCWRSWNGQENGQENGRCAFSLTAIDLFFSLIQSQFKIHFFVLFLRFWRILEIDSRAAFLLWVLLEC